jgi:Predicted nucleotide-binding protein containing TIR-like domain
LSRRLRSQSEAKLRARQNVVFELGFFIGALGLDRVNGGYKCAELLTYNWYASDGVASWILGYATAAENYTKTLDILPGQRTEDIVTIVHEQCEAYPKKDLFTTTAEIVNRLTPGHLKPAANAAEHANENPCSAPPYGSTPDEYKSFIKKFAKLGDPERILKGICEAQRDIAKHGAFYVLGAFKGGSRPWRSSNGELEGATGGPGLEGAVRQHSALLD